MPLNTDLFAIFVFVSLMIAGPLLGIGMGLILARWDR